MNINIIFDEDIKELIRNFNMDILNLTLGVILGFAVGSALMWYYWRRYKTTVRFKEEVDERLEQAEQAIKDKFKK